MKPKRVILTLTSNPAYTPYWPVMSEIWRTKFGIIPTLIFYGTPEEEAECNLENDFGEVYRLDRVHGVTASLEREWACVWALFYGTTLFPDDVCMLCGIDRVLLNLALFTQVEQLGHDPTNQYIVGLSDKLTSTPERPTSVYPVPYQIATGYKFQQIFNLSEVWEHEVGRVFNCRNKFRSSEVFWGLVDQYASDILARRTRSPGTDVVLLRFSDYLTNHQLRRVNGKFDLEGVGRGDYAEWRAERPLNPEGIEELKAAIPDYSSI